MIATEVLESPAQADKGAGRNLLLVVGYDGSAASKRALDRAAELLRGRDGWLEVVYVAHTPATLPFAPAAVAQMTECLDEESAALEKEVDARLMQQPGLWRFRRRDGSVVPQLLAVAKELQERYGSTKDIGIVVGSPSRLYHHLAGSVSASLARSARFPTLIVP